MGVKQGQLKTGKQGWENGHFLNTSCDVLKLSRLTDMAKHDLVFYSNRSTPKVVSKGEKPEPKQGWGKQTKRRAATADEEKTIASGRWLRVDEQGDKPSSSSYKASNYRKNLGDKRRTTNKKIAKKP